MLTITVIKADVGGFVVSDAYNGLFKLLSAGRWF